MAQFNGNTIKNKISTMIAANWPPPINEGDPMYIFEPFQATNEIKEAIKIEYFEAYRAQWGVLAYSAGPPEVGVPYGDYENPEVATAVPGPPANWQATAISHWCPANGTHAGNMVSMATTNYGGFSYVTFTVSYDVSVDTEHTYNAAYGLNVGDSIANEENSSGFPSILQTSMELNTNVAAWLDESPNYEYNYWSPFAMASWFGNSNANSMQLRAQQNAAAMDAFISRLSNGIASQMNHFIYGIPLGEIVLPVTKVQSLKVGASDAVYDYTQATPVIDDDPDSDYYNTQVATSYPFHEDPLLNESGVHIQNHKGQNYQTTMLDEVEDSDTFGEIIPDPTYNPNYGEYLYTTRFNNIFLGESTTNQTFTAAQPFITRDPITLDNVNLPNGYDISDSPANSLFLFETIFGSGSALNPVTDTPWAWDLTQTTSGVHSAYCNTSSISNLDTSNAASWRNIIQDFYKYKVRNYLKGWNYGEFSIDNGTASWSITFAEASSPVKNDETNVEMVGTTVVSSYADNNDAISFKIADLESMPANHPDYPVAITDYKLDYYISNPEEEGEPILDETLEYFTVNSPNTYDTTGSPESVLIEDGSPNPDYNSNYGDIILINIIDYVTDPDIIIIKSLDGKMAQRLPILADNDQPTGEYGAEWIGGLSELIYLQTYMTSKKGYEPILNEDYLVNEYDDEGNAMLNEEGDEILLNQLPEKEEFMAWLTIPLTSALLGTDNANGKSYRTYPRYAHMGGLKAKILELDIANKVIKVENKWRPPANSEVNITLDGTNVISVGDWFINSTDDNGDEVKIYMPGTLHNEPNENINLATGKFRGELEDVIEDDIVIEDNAIYNKYIEFQGSNLSSIMDYNFFCRCLAVEQSFGMGELKNYQYPTNGLLLSDGYSTGHEFPTEEEYVTQVQAGMMILGGGNYITSSLAEAVGRGLYEMHNNWINGTRLKQNNNSPLPYMSSFPPNVDIWGKGYISIMDLKLE